MVFLELFVGLVFGLVFFGVLFALAEPFMDKGGSYIYIAEESEICTKTQEKETAVLVVKKETKTEPVVTKPKRICLGEFVITAYCGEEHHHICNDGDAEITSTGTKPKQGRTIAVDPDVIPYGAKVYINGEEYIAEDCGEAIKGNRIDIFFDSHQDALDFGVQYANVEVDG
jgi:3D (Asp-Asp-Asp) domain-containing protein